jgi:hypothetical protein
MYNRAFEDTDGQVCEAVWMDVEAAAATIGEQNYESARRRRVRGEEPPHAPPAGNANNPPVRTTDQICELIGMDRPKGWLTANKSKSSSRYKATVRPMPTQWRLRVTSRRSSRSGQCPLRPFGGQKLIVS